MYLAEIHGKLSRENENKEDILTSDVFSFYKYADRKVFLLQFLVSLGLNIHPQDAMDAEFLFWPHYTDGTEPDLVIIVGEYYLAFEAKYHSGFYDEPEKTKHQINREIEGGLYAANNLDKEFRMVVITSDYFFRPETFSPVKKIYNPYLIWSNWQSVTLQIFQSLQGKISLAPETRLFAEDFYKLLLRKNLRSYEGTPILLGLPKLHAHQGSVFFEATTAVYRGDFVGFLPALGTLPQRLRQHRSIFFYPWTHLFQSEQASALSGRWPSGKLFFSPSHSRFRNLSSTPMLEPISENRLFYKEKANE